jgi:hypothetical protein
MAVTAPLPAPGASLQQLEADAAAAQMQLISGPGSSFDAMLGHLGACSELGVDLEMGRAGDLCLLQVAAPGRRPATASSAGLVWCGGEPLH